MKQFKESEILKQFDDLLLQSKEIITNATSTKSHDGKTTIQIVDDAVSFEWHLEATFLIYEVYGETHFLYKRMERDSRRMGSLKSFLHYVSIFKSARNKFASDGLSRIRIFLKHENLDAILLQAENMANDEQNYIVAPVLAGCALEYFLHEVCKKNSIEIEKRTASSLNEKLCEKEVYTAITKGQILSFLQIRNNAAHGNFPSVIDSRKMVSDVTHFITNNINLL